VAAANIDAAAVIGVDGVGFDVVVVVDVAPVGRAAVAGTDERCLSRRVVTLAAPPLSWKPSNPWVDRSLPEWRDASELVSLSPDFTTVAGTPASSAACGAAVSLSSQSDGSPNESPNKGWLWNPIRSPNMRSSVGAVGDSTMVPFVGLLPVRGRATNGDPRTGGAAARSPESWGEIGGLGSSAAVATSIPESCP
jgi:hypothetical protein